MAVKIRGAREHNLHSIDVTIGDGLTVVTGVSGSGKSSLAFDTLYHEARRRFLEVYSLGSTAERLAPADVDEIVGLGPAVAVGQNLLNRNPNSTVATASGLHPFLRLLFSHFSERDCHRCGTPVAIWTEDDLVARLVAQSKESALDVYAPLVCGSAGSHRTLLGLLQSQFDAGEIVVDGVPGPSVALDPAEPHDIEVLVSRMEAPTTAADARSVVESARALGATGVAVIGAGSTYYHSLSRACARCGAWYDDLAPALFHTPCPSCNGDGCGQCRGSGLHPQAAAVRCLGWRLDELLAQRVTVCHEAFRAAELPGEAGRLVSEVLVRLSALDRVGLGYLSLDRAAPTLSRGEAQRVRLAVSLTSRLEDLLHVLDEPTIGQHPADVLRLLPAFRELPGPVVYVEHDRGAAAIADQAIDIGPGAGGSGGRLLFSGPPSALWSADTPTGRHFSFRDRVPTPQPRPASPGQLTVHGARLHNLDGVDVSFPNGHLTAVTGVSGSGKSTLVNRVLVESLKAGEPVGCEGVEHSAGQLPRSVLVDQKPIGRNPRSNPATYTKLADTIRDIFAEQTGLSASHFSFNRPEGACAACKGMGAIEVKMRYLPSTWITCRECDGKRFSHDVLSREAEFGDARLSIADFLTLSVDDAERHLAGAEHIPNAKRRAALRALKGLQEVGLGYLPIGQPSTSLSGGEAQRVKLAKHLGRRSRSGLVFVLDEPSTGLHPDDIGRLLAVLDGLAHSGSIVVVVEHNTDIIRAADWVIDLGPGAGPEGGRVVYQGPPSGLMTCHESQTGRALLEEEQVRSQETSAPEQDSGASNGDPPRITRNIEVRGACVHNLKSVDVDFTKGALTVVTGVSGSGKSSLVNDVLESEARRRFLESLSLYERQSTKEGPEALVESVSGLGVALAVGPERLVYDRRATVGTATEIAPHLAVLLSWLGTRACPTCGVKMERDREWRCADCGTATAIASPRHFNPLNYAAACTTCHGVGTLQEPQPEKLILHPDKPLCRGAMHSPGFFPKGYLCEPYNGGYDMVRALAHKHGFDPESTPWCDMSPAAQHAFLFGDPEPMEVTFCSRTGRTGTSVQQFPGFYGWVRDWDVGGTYTDSTVCHDCGGGRLRPEYLAVVLGGLNMFELGRLTLWELSRALDDTARATEPDMSISDRSGASDSPSRSGTGERAGHAVTAASLGKVQRRLDFLIRVGLGYLILERVAATLSAGEAQRVRLAGLLGSGLTSLTVLLDEPSRGLHPSEVEALVSAIRDLKTAGNTVIAVEHDRVLIEAADEIIDVGPGAGAAGGRIVAQGSPEKLKLCDTSTGAMLRGEFRAAAGREPRRPSSWMTIRGARENNLSGEDVRLPIGCLVGVCGVSGSGKSTLIADTLGRALAPKKHTTSVAREPMEPGAHDAVDGPPPRTIVVDQSKTGLNSPASFLALDRPLRSLFASSADARTLGIDEAALARRCSACKGRGYRTLKMGFLPKVRTPCDTCGATGLRPEAWDVVVNGSTLPDLYNATIDQVATTLSDQPSIVRPLSAAQEVGLGYLVLRQPGHALSGGEAQRLKIARELSRPTKTSTLYILDEPTIGQHMLDVSRLTAVLQRLCDQGNTVVVVEHHPLLLAECDWLVELGPGGGNDGGRVVFEGTPRDIAGAATRTGPYVGAELKAAS